MFPIISLFLLGLTPLFAAPLYGEKGGYAGYASYNPFKTQLHSSVQEDGIRASAGSPDVSRTLVKDDDSQEGYDVPKNYEALSHKPTSQHGYDSNTLEQSAEVAPYAKATLYGENSGGYKLSDAYQNQHIQLNSESHQDYKDDYSSYPPQPYEFGYALKDGHGNNQHRQESSDGHGKVEGSYGFTDEHGLYRSVQYVADKGGFRATVKTNEPGTENQNPADVKVESEQDKH